MSTLRIGSRASDLARAQAEWVASRLPGGAALVWVRSRGDEDRETPLPDFGGVGVFTQALDRALLEDRIDVGVHSLKDLPTADVPGVRLACVPAREDARDAWIARDGLGLQALPSGSRVGTGSPRRIAQLRRVRPDLEYVGIRGNVPTRIGAVEDGRLDAVVLAVAGLRRLGLDARITEVLDAGVCVPAAGQGALGLVVRRGDGAADEGIAPVRDVRAAACTAAERAALRALGVGCHAPMGAHAVVKDGRVRLHARLCARDGSAAFDAHAEGALGEAEQIGQSAAHDLRAQGAAPLLEQP